jgi:hypothetical protein
MLWISLLLPTHSISILFYFALYCCASHTGQRAARPQARIILYYAGLLARSHLRKICSEHASQVNDKHYHALFCIDAVISQFALI